MMSVGDEERKQIRLSVAQKDVDAFLQQLDCQPHVRIKGRDGPLSEARLSKVNPRASHVLPHFALATTNGGPLAVRASEASEDTWELTEPHFLARIGLPASAARQLRAGELARIRIGTAGESIAAHLLGCARRWMHHRLESRGLEP